MKTTVRITLLAALFLGPALDSVAQNNSSSGQADPSTRSQQQEQQNANDMARRAWILADLERHARRKSEKPVPVARLVIDKPMQERIDLARRVAMKDAQPYLDFLKGKNVGIFKIFPNMSCISVQVVRIDGDCADFVPMSSLISFRHRAYIDAPYQDIEYADDEVRVNGFFVQGAVTDLGDVSIETAVSDTALASAIKSIGIRDALVDQARTTAASLKSGLHAGNYIFFDRARAVVGHTYMLRAVAYRPKASIAPASSESTAVELRFLALEFDKRFDSTIVFRILSKDARGGLTIIWKEMERAEAPKLRFTKGQALGDFK